MNKIQNGRIKISITGCSQNQHGLLFLSFFMSDLNMKDPSLELDW
jgi:hypothetical protein